MRLLKKCNSCKRYTIHNQCPKCKIDTIHPDYKFKKIRDAPKDSNDYFTKLRKKKND